MSAFTEVLAEREQLIERQNRITTLCSKTVQNPNENLGKLKELIKFLSDQEIVGSKAIRKLLIPSLTVVFKDILPTYRIRMPSEEEKRQKMAKETKSLWIFEETLLKWNKYHIKLNETVSEFCKDFFQRDSVGQGTLDICVAVHRLCRSMSYKLPPIVAATISVIRITEIINTDSKPKSDKRKPKPKLSRKEFKKTKMERKLEKDMAETKASQARESKIKLNTLILKEVLFVYFKILKTTTDSRLLSAVLQGLSNYAHLINVEYVDNLLQLLTAYINKESCNLLDGLHCIHTALTIITGPGASTALELQDLTKFHNHMYEILGRFIHFGRDLPTSGVTRLEQKDWVVKGYYHLSNTPAAMASRQIAEEKAAKEKIKKKKQAKLAILETGADPRTSVLSLDQIEPPIDLLLSCIALILVKRRRESSINRVLAFVKRLSSLTLTVTDPGCIANILISIMGLMRAYSQTEVLFDSEAEIGGPYIPNVNNVDFCQAASATLWEVSLLLDHPSPVVSKLAHCIFKWGNELGSNDVTSANLVKWNTMPLLPAPKTNDPQEAAIVCNLNTLLSLGTTSCRQTLARIDAQLCLSQQEQQIS
ncbi:Nucleolar complex protein 3, partial [Cichlidogyrus casuarinus]